MQFIIPVILLLQVLLLLRLHQVGEYRMYLVSRVGYLNRKEIESGVYTMWERRWKMLDDVSLNQMLLQFWRSPESFFEDYSILLEDTTT